MADYELAARLCHLFRLDLRPVLPGLYPIVTFQYSSTTLYQVSCHIQYLFFVNWQSDMTLGAARAGRPVRQRSERGPGPALPVNAPAASPIVHRFCAAALCGRVELTYPPENGGGAGSISDQRISTPCIPWIQALYCLAERVQIQ